MTIFLDPSNMEEQLLFKQEILRAEKHPHGETLLVSADGFGRNLGDKATHI